MPQQTRAFSKIFKEMDRLSINRFNNSFCGSKAYTKAVDLWKVPLEKKRLRRERKAMNPPKVQEPDNGEGIVVVHDAQQGVMFPPDMSNTFVVVQINGFQYRVF